MIRGFDMLEMRRSLAKLLELADKTLREKISQLNEEERKVLEYFIQHISVGSIIALRELRAFYRIPEPRNVINRLISLGLLEQGTGCYSLAKPLRDLLIKLIGTSHR